MHTGLSRFQHDSLMRGVRGAHRNDINAAQVCWDLAGSKQRGGAAKRAWKALVLCGSLRQPKVNIAHGHNVDIVEGTVRFEVVAENCAGTKDGDVEGGALYVRHTHELRSIEVESLSLESS